MEPPKKFIKERIISLVILILLIGSYFLLSRFDNPYNQIYKSKTLLYIYDMITKQYIHILSFALQSLLCALICFFIFNLIKPNKLKLGINYKRFFISFIPGLIIFYSCMYIILLAADDNKIANVISLIGTIFAFFYTTIKLIVNFIYKD